MLQGLLPSHWGWGGRAAVCVCVCVRVCARREGVGMEAPPVLQKSYTIFMSLLLVTLLLLPVALNHYNKVTIECVIHKNLQKYVHDISNLMAAKWGRFNRQMSNSKMAAKTEDGGWCLSTKIFRLANIYHHAKNVTSAQACICPI